jgi:hypothetical protein
MTILQAWNERRKLFIEGNNLHVESRKLCGESNKLCAEGYKLCAEGNRLHAESNKLYAKGSKLRAEGDKLYAEGNNLHAKGNLVFINAVISVHGNVEIKWDGEDATVEGVRYEFVEKAACEGKVVEFEGVQYKLVAVK